MNAIALGVLVAVLVGVAGSIIVTWASSLRPVVAILLAFGVVLLLVLIAVSTIAVYSR